MMKDAIEKTEYRILYTTNDETQARDVYDRILLHPLTKKHLRHARETPQKTILFNTGSTILIRVTAYPDALKGPAYDFVVCDEIQDAWTGEDFDRVVPALVLARNGTIVLSGQPRDQSHWYYQWYARGLEDKSGHWQTIVLPTPCGVLYQGETGKEALQRIKDVTDKDLWRRDYLCEWTVNSKNALFREDDLAAIATGEPSFAPRPGRQYVCACDLGWSKDRSAVVVLELPTRHVVHAELMPPRMKHSEQRHRVKAIKDRYRASICFDATGGGNPAQKDNYVELYKEIMPDGYCCWWNQYTAQEMITDLKFSVESRKLTVPACFEDVFLELRAYEKEYKDGKVTYHAPKKSSIHDDYVSALAMLLWMVKKNFVNTSGGMPIQYLIG